MAQQATTTQDRVVQLDVAAQPMVDALNQFATQAKVRIVFFTQAAEGLTAPHVVGSYTPDQALRKLLDRSDLQYRFRNPRTVEIRSSREARDVEVRKVDSRAASFEKTSMVDEGGGTIRLAQADSQANSNVRSTAAAVDQGGSAQNQKLEEVVVTGSHIRGSRDTSAPMMSFTRDQITQSGVSTTQEMFERLPQNFSELKPDGFLAAGQSRIAALNYSRAAGVDLRGLGAGSTLTLLNGTRRAGSVNGRVVDVSAIPLSAIERVEIVTGGRSAIYGSDAVAGVVNIITRRDFSGAETQATYGRAREGGGKLQLSQIFGGTVGAAHIMAAYDYSQDWALDLGGTSLVVSPDSTGLIHRRIDTQPDGKRHSVLASGGYDFSDRISGVFDAMYTSRKIESSAIDLYPGATNDSLNFTDDSSDHLSGSAAVNVALSGDWRLDLTGAASRVNSNTFTHQTFDAPAFGFVADFRDTRVDHAEIETVSAVANGSFHLGGTVTRLALGLERREERFKGVYDAVPVADESRAVNSAFAELQIPFERSADNLAFRRVELSLAGRLDHYDDFGNTFNPQVGVIVEAFRGLTLRSTYSRSFRAPALADLASPGSGIISLVPDPTAGSGVSPLLVWQGSRPQLDPERAKTWTAGFDFHPQALRSLGVSLSYFNISYRDRIDIPAVSSDEQANALVNSVYFPGLITRNPSAAELNALLSTLPNALAFNFTGLPYDPSSQTLLEAFPNLVIFDGRTNNIAIEKVDGIDLQIDSAFDSAAGRISSGLNATYTFSHSRNVTANSPTLSGINDVGKPVGFRVRGNAGLSLGAWGAFVYLTYVDSYRNTFSVPTGEISSWITTDLSISFDGRKSAGTQMLGGIRATLSVQNLFDRDPPTFLNNNLFGIRYDSTNANPFGRQVSVSLAKNW